MSVRVVDFSATRLCRARYGAGFTSLMVVSFSNDSGSPRQNFTAGGNGGLFPGLISWWHGAGVDRTCGVLKYPNSGRCTLDVFQNSDLPQMVEVVVEHPEGQPPVCFSRKEFVVEEGIVAKPQL